MAANRNAPLELHYVPSKQKGCALRDFVDAMEGGVLGEVITNGAPLLSPLIFGDIRVRVPMAVRVVILLRKPVVPCVQGFAAVLAIHTVTHQAHGAWRWLRTLHGHATTHARLAWPGEGKFRDRFVLSARGTE